MKSSGFTIRKATEPIITENVFITIYGKPGVGKTSIGFTMPGPCLHLDFDEGVHRAVAEKPDSIFVDRWEEFFSWVNGPEFEQTIKGEGYKSILIDTVGTMLDNVIAPALIRRSPKNGMGGSLSLQGWGLLSVEFGAFINRIKKLGLQIYATAHDKEGGDEATASVLPAIKGGSMDILFRTCDLLGYMYIRGTQRYIDFNPTEIHVGKNVAGLEPLAVPRADQIGSGFATFLADKAVAPTLERMNAKTKEQTEMVARVQEFIANLKGCKTPEDFDVLAGEFDGEKNEVYLKQARYFMSKRLQDLGIAYDKALGAFHWVNKAEVEPEQEETGENTEE